jgi:hypothetical protein
MLLFLDRPGPGRGSRVLAVLLDTEPPASGTLGTRTTIIIAALSLASLLLDSARDGRRHGDDYRSELVGCSTVRSECSSPQTAHYIQPMHHTNDATTQRRSPRANTSIPMTTSHASACYCVSGSACRLGEVSTVCDCLGEESTCLQCQRISLTFFIVQSPLGVGICALEKRREEKLTLRRVVTLTLTIGVVLKRRPNPWRIQSFTYAKPTQSGSAAVVSTRPSTPRYLTWALDPSHTMRSIQFQSRKEPGPDNPLCSPTLRCHGATSQCHTVTNVRVDPTNDNAYQFSAKIRYPAKNRPSQETLHRQDDRRFSFTGIFNFVFTPSSPACTIYSRCSSHRHPVPSKQKCAPSPTNPHQDAEAHPVQLCVRDRHLLRDAGRVQQRSE